MRVYRKKDDDRIEGFESPSISTMSSICISCFILMFIVLLGVKMVKKASKKR